MSDTYKSWLRVSQREPHTPLSPDRLAEMFQYTCKFGSGNLWTGQNGTACGYVRELLREVEHLRSQLEG